MGGAGGMRGMGPGALPCMCTQEFLREELGCQGRRVMTHVQSLTTKSRIKEGSPETGRFEGRACLLLNQDGLLHGGPQDAQGPAQNSRHKAQDRTV